MAKRGRKSRQDSDGFLSEQIDRAISSYINDISKRLKTITPKNISSPNMTIGASQCVIAILDNLVEHDNLTEIMLCRNIKYNASTVSIAMKKMVNENLISLTVDPNDRRRTIINITEKGLEAQKYFEDSYKMLDDMMLKGITKKEKKLLLSLLDKMLKNIMEIQGDFGPKRARISKALFARTFEDLYDK